MYYFHVSDVRGYIRTVAVTSRHGTVVIKGILKQQKFVYTHNVIGEF